MEDAKIVRMLWQRLESALEALAKKYGRRLQLTARNILGDDRDAEEAVSDTYLAVWNTVPPERPDPLCAYVLRIGRNAALKLLRSRAAQKRDSRYDISLDELSECIPSHILEETLDARALGKAINSFLDTLTPDNRALFLRRYWFGDAVKDIAPDLLLTQQAASVRLHRLRNQLKDYLYKEGFFL